MGSENGYPENQTETSGEKSGEQKLSYDLYPERRDENTEKSFLEKFKKLPSKALLHKEKCEANIIRALKTNPMVRLLVQALESAGCPVKFGRHICCEECDVRVTGGYDVEWNQIVVCQNSYKSRKIPEVTLIHELIHMFDYCVNHIDFNKNEHLACTEIRAANLSHCSFLSSLMLKQSSLFNIKETHQNCVKMKATQSMMVAKNMDFETALGEVLKVFDKCYNDLEPIGRRVRRSSCDPLLSYKEGKHYGYGKKPSRIPEEVNDPK
ncbi:UNVERIFIED_CONTAM: hypothetical protein PYX00_005256 [Menopon gallinae]|uniref:Mitochondrial inner membrane protease ATP23 n=1 Tax=Menopon gallinae TaxID=328185 RepID=A0AAW2HQY3_9NEOP